MTTKTTKTIKVNKFTRELALTHKAIVGKRSAMFGSEGFDASEEYIRAIIKRKKAIEKEIMHLEDFHVGNSTSLKVTSDGFNSEVWVRKMNEKHFELHLIQDELDVAQSIHTEWFE